METNPYAAPGAVVEDAPVNTDLESRKATRWQRFWGAFIDSFIVGMFAWPLSMWWASHYGINHSASAQLLEKMPFTGPTAMGVSAVLLLVIVAINLSLLSKNGQTIGKRTVGTKLVRTDGSTVEVWRVVVLRWLPLFVVRWIPFVGSLAGIVDALVIFGSDKRCIHDYIADTIVITD
jgi:uncharacterized RDD family membrane protein YckC